MPSDALWAASRVEIKGDELCFVWQGLKHLRPPSTLLERFLRLGSDVAILTFAKKFGPLSPRGLYGGDGATSSRADEHRESLHLWRRRQLEFNGVLALIAAVREKESPAKETFAEFQEFDIPPGYRSLRLLLEQWESCSLSDRLATARAVFLKRIGTYVRHCGLRPALTIEMNRAGPQFGLVFQDARADFVGVGLSLFGALTVQLMSAATGSALAICSACNNFFVPRRRRPAFGKRRYCRTCGRGAATRDAKADYRAELRRLGVRKMSDVRT